MSKLDDNLKASKKIIEPKPELIDRIMKAVYQLPAHNRNSWRRLNLVWATPVAVALLIVIIIASPIAGKLDINKLSLNTSSNAKLNANSKTNTTGSNTNSTTSSPKIGNNL